VKLSITSGALEDLEAWSTTNPKVLSKIIRLIAETTRTPQPAEIPCEADFTSDSSTISEVEVRYSK